LNDSRLFWLIEVSPDEDLNSIFSTTFFKNLFNGVFDEDARKRIGLVFKERDAFKVEIEEFEKQCRKLKDTLNDLQLRLSFFSPENEELGAEGIWKLQKFLANFNPRYMTNKPTPLPVEDWDHFALDGENITNVMFNGVPMLKIDGAQPAFALLLKDIGGASRNLGYPVRRRDIQPGLHNHQRIAAAFNNLHFPLSHHQSVLEIVGNGDKGFADILFPSD
ncbi:hypothetical protein, partial [Halomonas flagellata]|uniref:hypothetical protein n=1 Tax=Halomonas flagellata TaxID=2920385 RepID=UPI0034DE0384